MARKSVYVVKPSRCSHPRWDRFASSPSNRGYFRCCDCGSVRSGKQIDVSLYSGKSGKKARGKWVAELDQLVLFVDSEDK